EGFFVRIDPFLDELQQLLADRPQMLRNAVASSSARFRRLFDLHPHHALLTNCNPSQSAIIAGLASPSISTVACIVERHCPGDRSAMSFRTKRPRMRLPARTGVRKRTCSKP